MFSLWRYARKYSISSLIYTGDERGLLALDACMKCFFQEESRYGKKKKKLNQ